MSYLDDVIYDVKQYIIENYETDEYTDIDESDLYDELFCNDSVTGNASGSYTFNRYKAQQNIQDDDFETIVESINDGLFDSESLGRAIVCDEWEKLDVICRCTVLGEAISKALDELQ